MSPLSHYFIYYEQQKVIPEELVPGMLQFKEHWHVCINRISEFVSIILWGRKFITSRMRFFSKVALYMWYFKEHWRMCINIIYYEQDQIFPEEPAPGLLQFREHRLVYMNIASKFTSIIL